MTQPFLTIITPTFRRPTLLAACLESVGHQTEVGLIEHLVLPDHVGLGIGEGLYGRLPHYVEAVHGRYVHVLADDDVLASPYAVALVHQFAVQHGHPDVILVNATKQMEQGWLRLPRHWEGQPVLGAIDLACLITRRDVWVAHVQDYGRRYEGDYDYAAALHRAGRQFARLDYDFVRGAVMRGRPE